MADMPRHLQVMHDITGTIEAPGDADNPIVLGFARKIAELYPDMATYCNGYVHDAIPWCGLTVAYCMAMAGIRPVFGPTDTDKFLWAQAWKKFGTPVSKPQLGDVMVFAGHVTLYDGQDGDAYLGRGGNQSDQVKVSRYPRSSVEAFCRAPGVEAIPADIHPLLKIGSTGDAVLELQKLLPGIDQDGEFGPATDAAVRAFQSSHQLDIDGEVGPDTWRALLGGVEPVPDPHPVSGLNQMTVDSIITAARKSDLARHDWAGRGRAPAGYINGMAAVFGLVYLKLKTGDHVALAMAAPPPASSLDALALYADKLFAINANFRNGGVDTLRALWTLETGLGLRESSGGKDIGIDLQAGTGRPAEEIEAGIFQQSWNSHSASPLIRKLFDLYSAGAAPGFAEIFREGVTPINGPTFGSGDAAAFQVLAKASPAFAAQAAGVGLRVLRNHWGPINREEAEVVPAADALFRQVQAIVDAQHAPQAQPQTSPQPSDQTKDDTQGLPPMTEPMPDAQPGPIQIPGFPIKKIDLGTAVEFVKNHKAESFDFLSLLNTVHNSLHPDKAITLPPAPVAPSAPAADQVTQRPSVKIGAGVLAISSILQGAGFMPMPFGDPNITAHLVSTLSTLLPIAVAGLGMVGGWGPIAAGALKIVGPVINASLSARAAQMAQEAAAKSQQQPPK